MRRFWNGPGPRSGGTTAQANVAVVLGTERIVDGRLRATALAIGPGGTMLGFQDKVQIDPFEQPVYAPGMGRRLFHAGPLVFGIAICHDCGRINDAEPPFGRAPVTGTGRS